MPITVGQDTAKARKSLSVNGQTIAYYSIPAATAAGLGDFSKLPASLKVVLENMLRFEDGGYTVSVDDIKAFAEWGAKGGKNPREIAYRPARVLMQDFTGVPAVVDLAAMRDGIKGLGGNAQKINPLVPVDLVIDHSVMIDEFGNPRAFQKNVDLEYERNMERYEFLKWGQTAFENFRVVPPGTGICHQVNLEYLTQTVWTDKDQSGTQVAYPDTLVGTDSHTTMVNGAAVLGWGVGGIEAEAVMLGQPVYMLTPEVVILGPDDTVAEALARIRDPDWTPSIASQVYVCRPPLRPPTGRYLGVVFMQRLLREPPSMELSRCLREVATVRHDTPEREVFEEFASYDMLALPVVDEAGRLLGAVSVDDVVDRMLGSGWRQRSRRKREMTHPSVTAAGSG